MRDDAGHVGQEEGHRRVLQHAAVLVADDAVLDVRRVGAATDLGQVQVEVLVEAHVARLAGELGEHVGVGAAIRGPAIDAEAQESVIHGGVVHLGLGDEEGAGIHDLAHVRFLSAQRCAWLAIWWGGTAGSPA